MADVASSLKNWSTVLSSNAPTSATTIGSGLAPNFQQIQSTLRNELASRSTSVTAAATTDIGAKDEGTVLVTNAGTIAITGFGTVSAGIKKLVTFVVSGGSLSITYNASSMILPSSANITVATGDSLIAESLGSGNWKVHAYYRQDGSTITGVSSAQLQAQTYTAFPTAGTSTAFTLTPIPAITANTTNTRFNVTLNAAPGASPTLAISGQTAKNFKYYDSTGTKQFITSTVAPSGWNSDVIYDGTDWVMLSVIPTAAASVTGVEKRQTIVYGPIASGIADLITQAQVGATLATGVSTNGTFLATVGNGFNTDGSQKNLNLLVSSVKNSGLLAGSVTNYMWLDAVTGSVGVVSVADAFQYGGTIPVTNNQYTYDYLNHVMYLGNGATATQSNRVIIAEIDTNGTVVTAIRVRSYNGFYDSGFTATLVGAAGTYNKNHNMGTKELEYWEVLECTTIDLAYAVGDQLTNMPGNAANDCATFSVRSNNISTRRASTGAYFANNNTTGATANLTAASWKYKVQCRRKF